MLNETPDSFRFDIQSLGIDEIQVTNSAKQWAAPSLVQLPLDTIVHILSLVSPLDILSLRQTCKTLATASKVRIVWINALRQLCLRHYAFCPSFPYQKMKLSELEHAATSPERFAILLRRELSTGVLQPLATRILKPRLPKNTMDLSPGGIVTLGEFHDLSLVSGGRFLVTNTTSMLVQLWDLGHSPHMLVNPYPLASLVEEDFIMDMLTQPGPGETIRLVLVSRAEIRLKADVYEIEPLSSAPCFEKIGNFSIGLSFPGIVALDAYCLTRDTFTFQIHGRICVWNFVEDSWAMWFTERPCLQLHMARRNILQLEATGIIIWDIPPLLPRVSAQEALVEGHAPLLVLECPLRNPCFPYPSVWHFGDSSKDQPLHFDIIGLNSQNQQSLVRFAIKPVDTSSAEGDLPSCLPIRLSQSILGIDSQVATTSFRSGRLTDQDVLLIWRGSTGSVNASLSPWARTRGLPVPSTSGVLWSPSVPLVGGSSFDHCPTSGRLCVMMCDEIRVMDYLLPPAVCG